MAQDLRTNGTRQDVLEHLEAHPGIQIPELARALDLHPSTASYHVRKLAEKGRLVRHRTGRHVHLYPIGRGWCPRARHAHATLTPAARLAAKLALRQGATSGQCLTDAGHSRSAARYALQRLVDACILERVAWGVYTVADGWEPCLRSALQERACTGCNPGAKEMHA